MNKKLIKGFPIMHEEVMVNLRKARIQIDQAIDMIKGKKNCMAVIDRSKDVQNSLREANLLLLENHLKTCISDLKSGKDSRGCIEEIMKIFKANTKRV